MVISINKKHIVCLKYKIVKSRNYKVNGSWSAVFNLVGSFFFLRRPFPIYMTDKIYLYGR